MSVSLCVYYSSLHLLTHLYLHTHTTTQHYYYKLDSQSLCYCAYCHQLFSIVQKKLFF